MLLCIIILCNVCVYIEIFAWKICNNYRFFWNVLWIINVIMHLISIYIMIHKHSTHKFVFTILAINIKMYTRVLCLKYSPASTTSTCSSKKELRHLRCGISLVSNSYYNALQFEFWYHNKKTLILTSAYHKKIKALSINRLLMI